MFMPPSSGEPVRAPAVTPKFLAPLAAVLFSSDHIATLGQEHLYATITPGQEKVGHAAAVPEAWAWVRRGTVSGPTYAIDLATFRALRAATARSDGTFDSDGEHGRLVALSVGGVFTAVVRGWPEPPTDHESVPPPPPMPSEPHAAPAEPEAAPEAAPELHEPA